MDQQLIVYPSHSNEYNSAMWQQRQKLRSPGRVSVLVIVILCIGVILTVLNIYQLQQMKLEHSRHDQPITIIEPTPGHGGSRAPVVWIHGKRMETGYLKHVRIVFERLGFIVSSGDLDWDVMWAHDYPFTSMAKIITALKPHQRDEILKTRKEQVLHLYKQMLSFNLYTRKKVNFMSVVAQVNHFPGSGHITNKVSLATSQSKAIPMAFKIPQEKSKFLEHVKHYPEKLWVQKNNNHRGIKIKKVDELDFDSEGSFVQEYVSKPFLIDERKFDIGVYTIMTSLKPLRVYIVHDEALFRFCGEPYHPFDELDVKKYVISDDYKPMWEMPSLKETLINQRYGFKETFNEHVRRQGKNVTQLWDDIYDTIRTIYLEKEASLLSAASMYKTTRNFFEMVRYDFVLDEDGKVYLMEVNMSPNLSTGHFSGNRRLYEHVVFNTLRVARVASMVENQFLEQFLGSYANQFAYFAYTLRVLANIKNLHLQTWFNRSLMAMGRDMSKEDREMQVSDKEISVFPELCTLEECAANCGNMKCMLCSPCLNSYQREYLKDAYIEHINRGGCRRIFPPSIHYTDAVRWSPESDVFNLLQYKESDKIMFIWFIGMCRKDATWCI